MSGYHIAQVNIARMLAPIDDPLMADFVANLPAINALAEQSRGFIWRLQSDDRDATSIRIYEDEMIVINLTVWESPDALRAFAYRSDHYHFLRDRKRWFEKFDGPYIAIWWIPIGHIPTTDETKEPLEYLRVNGESPLAFSFKHIFPEPRMDA